MRASFPRWLYPGQAPGTNQSRRRKVQEPITTAYQEYRTEACGEKFEKLLEDVESHEYGEGKRRFVRHARKYLRPVVKKFLQAAQSDLTTYESLHGLRIRTKKLGYTMEIVAVAFAPAFRKKLYPQVRSSRICWGQ